jgi:hypothetical protein
MSTHNRYTLPTAMLQPTDKGTKKGGEIHFGWVQWCINYASNNYGPSEKWGPIQKMVEMNCIYASSLGPVYELDHSFPLTF